MVFIIKYLTYDGCSPEGEIVGICDSQDKAFKYAIKSIIERLSYSNYDPRERYFRSIRYRYGDAKDTICYSDEWECKTGCSNYTIEEWELNNESGNKLKTWYVNFDKAIKTCIVENKIMSEMIKPFIKSLESQLDTIDFCMNEKKEEFGLSWAKRKEPTEEIVEKWNKFYGKVIDEDEY